MTGFVLYVNEGCLSFYTNLQATSGGKGESLLPSDARRSWELELTGKPKPHPNLLAIIPVTI